MANANKGPAAIAEGAKRFLTGFGEFTAGQKAVVIAVVVALIAGGVAFSRWASTPSYTPMYTNLSGADAAAVVEKLKASGTPYELGDGGSTISVPQANVYEARLEIAKDGLIQESESASLLDKAGVTTSAEIQNEAIRKDLANELEDTIESIDGVNTAVVNLAIPKKDVFIAEQQPTTASVLLGLKPGTSLTDDQVRSVVNLVSGGVAGMDPKNVSVVDGKGNTLSTDGQGGGTQQKQADEYNNAESTRLQAMLEQVFGPGNVKATVSAELDFDERIIESEEFTRPTDIPPAASTERIEEYTGGAPAVGGVLGPDNIQAPAGQEGASQYRSEERTVDNKLDTKKTTTKAAPGSVKRKNVAVVLDAQKAGTADVAQVQAIVTSAVGIDPNRGDTVNVIKTAFDTSAADEAAKALKEAEEAEKQDELLSYGKTAALALLVFIMLIVVLLSFRRRKVEEIDVASLPIHLGDITDETLHEPVLPPAPPVPALPAAPVDPALEAAAFRRDTVVELVSRQPEEVAELLRGWLADRRS
ncbi:flagellar M-ring protein FliF [Kineococcus xinjiangensis]|uniref:Flagellar M-ring protein n=1 Tax=Kineococcus xinjiangensis TaxID=512762 RepID=A0A2S6IK07_9ACTN|nr:flagellar basal-body MS-ring/collar protein FliF [Kineococcus xinjiangensis]PPK94511.1 flagellar M-ring protein FliF [Kineococcus xinjiangensis]